MSLRDLIKDLAASALPLLDDIPVQAEWIHGESQPFYDTATGSVDSTPAAASTVALVLSPVGRADRAKAQKENMPVGDIEALVLDTSQFTMRPATGDLVNIGLDQYRVLDVTPDEVEATVTAILQRIGGGASDDQN